MLMEEKEQLGSKQRFTPRLSKKEKHYIEKVAAISGHNYNTVKDIFLAVSICAVLDMYSNQEEINLPYLFNAKIDLTRNHQSKKLEENYTVETNIALKNIIDKISKKETTWVESYIKTQIKMLLSRMLDIKN